MQTILKSQSGNQAQHTLREQIVHALDHLDHVLPGQAPILDFVHHNTIHGFQHLPFEEALKQFGVLTGISAYLPEARSRDFYQQGRIDDSDIADAIAHSPHLNVEEIFLKIKSRTITRKDIYLVALLFDLQPLPSAQLKWHADELNALDHIQPDVPASVREQLITPSSGSGTSVRQLWNVILSQLDLNPDSLHTEELLDFSKEQAQEWLDASVHTANARHGNELLQEQIWQQANELLDRMLGQIGDTITLRGLVQAVSGVDILDFIRPQLIRICASAMDEGLAAWQIPDRSKLGLYGAWRATIQYDAHPFLSELPGYEKIIDSLPEDPLDAIILHLTQLQIPQEKWDGYLRRLALEIPGWSGLINWRQHHPGYEATNDAKPNLAGYLAIRLTLDRLWLNRVCREKWRTDGKLGSISAYFRINLAEFLVCTQLYQGELPEYLSQRAESLTMRTVSDGHAIRAEWQKLLELTHTWQLSPVAERQSAGHTIHNSGWKLFRLFQHLGLGASYVQAMNKEDLLRILSLLDEFNLEERSKIWLYAYERHYRESVLHALRANRNRGRWAKRDTRPEAQIIFCMDDREEGIRRHLEELNPAIETLGAAGFFGLPINYKGLDDEKVVSLCPIVVTPSHEIQEQPRAGTEEKLGQHKAGLKLLKQTTSLVYQSLRHNLFLSQPLINLMAPLTFMGLLGKSLAPQLQKKVLTGTQELVAPPVDTELRFIATDTESKATPDNPRLGLTDTEQANMVTGLLRNIGLTYGFGEIVVVMGHGSISQNNPHLAAYDCGACSGRHGGPNARLFAAIINRPEIRLLLEERGISVPSDTWFIGAEHNTCNEEISWYDLEDIPPERLGAVTRLYRDLGHGQRMSAHERCRRLASAPRNPTAEVALKHIEERATDFSQARPELGHATNAFALVGRRSVTQGAFFDRRIFLISYDPTQDADGSIIERILLAVGPVGAGISLEYYFSTVNNERLGSGTKVPHNVTGMFGVMEGASSDLRTGLPRQMIEIHEAMRLHLMVEAKNSVLGEIYGRQPAIQELVGGGWVLLSSIDPDTGEMYIFERGVGFVPWQAEKKDLPVYEKSPEYYRSHSQPLAPVLIKQPGEVEAQR